MNALPLIIGAGIAIFAFGKSSNSSKSSNSNTEKEDEIEIKKGLIDVSKIPSKQLLALCTTSQYRNNKGECVDFWIDGETDDRVKQEFDSIVKNNYKGKSLNDLCDDKKVKFDILPNPNANDIIKLTITNLWKPVITSKMLPPTNKSPDFVKVIWKKVTDLYFSKVCGL